MRKPVKIIIFLIMAFAIFVAFEKNFVNNDQNEKNKNNNHILIYSKKKEEEKRKQQIYDTCMNDSYDYSDDVVLSEKIDEVNSFLNNYKAYVSYSELNDDFYFGYKDEQTVYGASLIKLVDALYVLDKDVDINGTVKYAKNFYNKDNKGLTKHNVGDDLKIDDVVSYALTWSDNGAHHMLVKYIGFSNLKEYGLSLGAKHTLEGGDEFGFQTAYDTNIYLNRLYDLLLTNDNAKKFKDYMINDFHSYLDVNNLKVSHKYGYYDNKFHDIGIVYDENPYAISVLTLYGKGDYENKINEISVKINELHNLFWQEKKTYCENLMESK